MLLIKDQNIAVKIMILSRYHFQVIVTHGDTTSIIVTLTSFTVYHRPPPFHTVPHRPWGDGGGTVRDGERPEFHDDGLWVTPAKIGNGTVMGQNHNFYSI